VVVGPIRLLRVVGGPTGWLTIDAGGTGTVSIPLVLALVNLLG
jgi:hypothetical protein